MNGGVNVSETENNVPTPPSARLSSESLSILDQLLPNTVSQVSHEKARGDAAPTPMCDTGGSILAALLATRHDSDHVYVGEESGKRYRGGRAPGPKRRAAAAERVIAEEAKRRHARHRKPAPVGEQIIDRMVGAMEPGKWYSTSGILRLIGDRTAHAKVRQGLFAAPCAKRKARRAGPLVDRALNAKWDPNEISPWLLMSGTERAPKWLYRLNAKGEALRETVWRLRDALHSQFVSYFRNATAGLGFCRIPDFWGID